jgi:transcription antitermination factor NusG
MPNLALTSKTQVATYPASGSLGWYALHTRTRYERRISQQVQLKHHEAYVPVVRERHRWSDRVQTVEAPIFPGYVFVRETEDSAVRLSILQTNGVHAFVGFNGVVARITDEQINDLRRLEEHGASWSPYPFLKTGSRVRIVGGCLDGLEGIFTAERGEKFVISIEPMQRSIAIDIAGYHIEEM